MMLAARRLTPSAICLALGVLVTTGSAGEPPTPSVTLSGAFAATLDETTGAVHVAADGHTANIVAFDGEGGFLDLGDLKLTAPATIAAWVWVRDADDDRRLVSQLDGPTTQSGALWLQEGALQVAAGQWRPVIRGPIPRETWVHIAVVYGADQTATGYLDGRRRDTVRSGLDFAGVRTGIGARFVGEWGRPFSGRMRDLRILPTDLSAEEIEAMYRATLPNTRPFPGAHEASRHGCERLRLDLSGTWWATAVTEPADPVELPPGPDKAQWLPVREAGYVGEGLDTSSWAAVTVPCNFEALGPGMVHFRGTCWFRRDFDVPPSWRDRRVVVRFHGVNNQCAVWVNGGFAGANADPFLPFEFDVSDLVRLGERNVIAVRVNNEDPWAGLPSFFGWRSEGGILRGVEIEAGSALRLEHVAITAEPQGHDGALSVAVTVANEYTEEVTVVVSTRVRDAGGRQVARLSSGHVTAAGAVSTETATAGEVDGARPWTPDDPVLYSADVELTVSGHVVDRCTRRFGFRNIATRGTQLLLNGQPTYLMGFNRHEDSPRTGMAVDLETTRKDLLNMKRLGANFVRLCHYPHCEEELDLCDEIGLLCMGEIPFYMADIDTEGKRSLILETGSRQLEKMIRRDRCHPSVIFWSVGNECNEEQASVRGNNEALVRLAQRLDPSRLATHVSLQSYWPQTDLGLYEWDDVICLNAYGYMNHGGAAAAWLTENLGRLHARYPGKPILITEFGQYARDKSAPVQSIAIERDFQALQEPFVCGALIWCYANHGWPPGGFLGDGFDISTYGLYYRNRVPGRAVRAVERLFTEKRESLARGLLAP